MVPQKGCKLSLLLELAERRLLPDALVRFGIRRLLDARLREEQQRTANGERAERIRSLFASGPIAVETNAANEQHYEVPASFFQRMLGPRLKYSSCWWDDGCQTLAAAEEAMLRLTCERAQIADGQRILELGCGWGSLTQWIAEQHPAASIVAISNSRSQQSFIQSRCQALSNIEVRVCNVAELDLDEQFDRVVSVEMFEHVRNWQQLLTQISGWLAPKGKCFLHTFCHRELFYPFIANGENSSENDWMAQHFFSGGVMPSFDLLEQLDKPLRMEQQWKVSGKHYAKTCEAWLAHLDANTNDILEILRPAAARQLARWRIFVMACEELFAFGGGNEWFVSHTLLRKDTDLVG